MKTTQNLLLTLLLFVLTIGFLSAQAQLSFQGILKKANGTAVDDGEYAITFRLYENLIGGTPVWEETQPTVDVTSGVYSVFLGSVTPLDVSFNTTYYLGVKVGSGSELTPRFRLSSAPYALSLIGQNNQFPSTGPVSADQVQASSGAPSAQNPHGYTFSSGGDEDGGMYSIADGEVSLYVNGTKRIEMLSNPSDETIIHGPLTISEDINLMQNGKISYNGLSDWRMVYESDFSGGADGWASYGIGSPFGTDGTNNGITIVNSPNPFISELLSNTQNLALAKRQFDLTNIPHTEVKVTFNYYFIGGWVNSAAYAGFSTGAQSNAMITWYKPFEAGFGLNGLSVLSTGSSSYDYSEQVDMVAENDADFIWVLIGGAVTPTNGGRWGVNNIKVWVR